MATISERRTPTVVRGTPQLDFDGFMRQRLPDLIERMPSFPARCCLDTCRHIWGDLRELWGEVQEVQGYLWNPGREAYEKPHVWLELGELILDPTVGQFVGGPPWQVIEPGNPIRSWYWRASEKLWE